MKKPVISPQPPSLRRRVPGRLVFLLAWAIAVPLALHSAPPSWWQNQSVTTGATPNDYAAINQGQLKYLAKSAITTMNANLPGGAGQQLNAMVAGWQNPTSATNDYASVNLGQLKNLAQPFYDRLMLAGLAEQYPWSYEQPTPNDFGVANIGQAKQMFHFAIPAQNQRGIWGPSMSPPGTSPLELNTTGALNGSGTAYPSVPAYSGGAPVDKSTDTYTSASDGQPAPTNPAAPVYTVPYSYCVQTYVRDWTDWSDGESDGPGLISSTADVVTGDLTQGGFSIMGYRVATQTGTSRANNDKSQATPIMVNKETFTANRGETDPYVISVNFVCPDDTNQDYTLYVMPPPILGTRNLTTEVICTALTINFNVDQAAGSPNNAYVAVNPYTGSSDSIGNDPDTSGWSSTSSYSVSATLGPTDTSTTFSLSDTMASIGQRFDYSLTNDVSQPIADQTNPDSASHSTTLTAGDAAGPKYRKIGLNGVPMPDGKPQNQDEAGEEPEETYIDALNRQLRHSSTDVYVPLASTLLPLMVRRDLVDEGWDTRSGVRGSERPDRPFGIGWTSNICSSVTINAENYKNTDGSYTYWIKNVVVTDEQGSSASYINVPGTTSWIHDRAEHQNVRTVNNTLTGVYDNQGILTGFVYRKKFGTTCFYEITNIVQVYNADRVSPKPGTYPIYRYMRLYQVVDRYGNELDYSYPDSESTGKITLIPSKISDPARLGHQVQIQQGNGVVTQVTAPNGDIITYGYNNATSDGSGYVLGLATVTKGSGSELSTVSYGYSVDTERDPTPSSQETTAGTIHYFVHMGVNQITDELQGKYQFDLTLNDDSTYESLSSQNGSQIRKQFSVPRYVSKVTLPDQSQTVLSGSCVMDPLTGGTATTTTSSSAGQFRWDFGYGGIWRQILPDPSPDPNNISSNSTIIFSVLTRTGPLGKETYQFEAGGTSCNGLVSTTDVSGNTTTFVNDGNWDDPITQTNAMGKTRHFTYDANTRVMTSLTDERGVQTVWVVDTLGRRKSEVISGPGGGGTQTTFEYDQRFLGFLTSKVVTGGFNPGTITTNYTRDAVGRVAQETTISQYWNVTVGHNYDGNGNKTAVFDGNGNKTTFAYDSHNRLSLTTYPDTLTKQYFYDAHGNKKKEIDDLGNITTYGYDALNRLQSTEVDLVSGTQISIKTVSYTYNGFNEVLTRTETPGPKTINGYDAGGRLTSKSVGYELGDSLNQVTQYAYEAHSNCGGELFETSGFRPTSVTDPNGYVTNFTYDALYRTTQKIEPQSRITVYTLDEVGNQTAVNLCGLVTQTTFDCLNRPSLITNPDGTMRTMTYSVNGKVSLLQDEMGLLTQTFYNAAGLPVEVITPGGAVAMKSYDANGNVTGTCDPLGNTTLTSYDSRNRPLKITGPSVQNGTDGTYTNPTTTNAYDNAGLKITTTDPLNRVTVITKDGAHRVLTVKDPLLGVTTTTYDPNGNALTVEDANGAKTTNYYDVFNRLTSTEDPNQITTSFGYDFNNNKTSVKDGDSHETIFGYDGLNRLISLTRPSGIEEMHSYDSLYERSRFDGVHTLQFNYDLRGRLWTTISTDGERTMNYDNLSHLLSVTEASSSDANVSYSYDLDGHMVSETSRGVTHAYSYDAAGRRIRTAYGSGRVVEMTYDGEGHLIGEIDGQNMTNWYYDAAGQMVAKWLPNNQYETNEYDLNGRLHCRKLYQNKASPSAEPTNLLAEFCWEHDAIGTVMTQSEKWPGSTRANAVRSTKMGYDAGYRLMSETVTEGSTTTETDYTYDDAGNRLTRTKIINKVVQAVASYQCDSDNKLYSWSEIDGSKNPLSSTTLFYDNAGNRTSQALTTSGVSGIQTTFYGWDAENRLTAVGLPTGQTYVYAYDFRHRRITKSQPSGGLGSLQQATAVVFSGGVSEAEYPVNFTWTAIATGQTPTVEYQRGPDAGGGVGGLLYSIRGGVQSFDVSDGRGDVVGQTNAAGALTWTASYEAYGKRSEETGTNLDPQRGNSKDEDATGLLDEGFRYRDLETGVFISRDPAGFVDGPNVYAYVKENPWSSFDPEGLEDKAIGNVYVIINYERKVYYVGETSAPVEERWSDTDHKDKAAKFAEHPKSRAFSHVIKGDYDAAGDVSERSVRMKVERDIQKAMADEFGQYGYKPLPTKKGKEPLSLSDDKYKQAQAANPRLEEGGQTETYVPEENKDHVHKFTKLPPNDPRQPANIRREYEIAKENEMAKMGFKNGNEAMVGTGVAIIVNGWLRDRAEAKLTETQKFIRDIKTLKDPFQK